MNRNECDAPRVLAIVGPTASGKSSLAMELARRLGGEIVSCDSMQIYRGMDIGTAKPTEAERAEVAHHMIDICSPERDYSCAEYVLDASKAIEQISARGALPILCGGTGLYLDSLLRGGRFAPDLPPEAVEAVEAMPIDRAYAELERVDPIAAANIHINNEKRVRRALAICLGTGKPKSVWDEESRAYPSPYRAEIIGLDYDDRAVLYDRIDCRVNEMMEQGLLDEAKRLNLRRDSTAGQAIGYKELYRYLDGTMSLLYAVALLKQNTRRYAKRQLTWFRRTEGVHWIFPDRIAAEGGTDVLHHVLSLIAPKKEDTWT